MSQHSLLRLSTCGSVDDGKSTLIGRLMYDTKSIPDDQVEALVKSSQLRGEDAINLAMLTDGLKAEREQGITIDVAYRYFSTKKRKFIIADTPGHLQYTRNMVTGASNCNASLILIDARKGMTDQTKRHAVIASLLQIPHLIVCINKMDLVAYREDVYEKMRDEFSEFASKLDVKDISFIPLCALSGDNVVVRSDKMPWYEGTTLLFLLENLHIASDFNLIDFRFPVQSVIRPRSDAHHDFRAYAGRLAGGTISIGDEVMVLPSGMRSTVSAIHLPSGEADHAFTPQSVALQLTTDIDISRGDMIIKPKNQPSSSQDLDLMICWFDSAQPLREEVRYILRHTTTETKCFVKEIIYKMDITTLHRDMGKGICMNDIARVILRTTTPLFTDQYKKNKVTGSIILIDEFSNATVAAGMVL